MLCIYIDTDTDACPVKQEIYRVAEHHARKGVSVVTTGLNPAVRADKPHRLSDQVRQ
jgi:uncharacterized protein YaiI (UPF0178 family)